MTNMDYGTNKLINKSETLNPQLGLWPSTGPSAGPNSRIFMGPCLFSWTSGGWDAKLTESMVDNGD